VASGVPTASISGTTANNSLYITGDGALATTNKESLTIGSASTGNISIFGIGTGVVQANSGILSTGLVQNNELQNNSITINTSTGLSGGGAVALGGSLTLTNTGVTSALAGTGISVSGSTGAVTISNTGVTSITGGSGGSVLTGGLTLANSITATSTITIDNASTAQKGIAQFNSTNFSDNGSGTINTIQNINNTATPTFSSLTLSANTNELTLGTTNTGIITLGGLTNTRTYTLPDATGTFCLTSGNCAGSGTGVTQSGTNANGQVAYFTSSNNITSSANFLFTNDLEINGANGGKAATIVNQLNTGDIFTASASGATKFTIAESI